jgi:hypothetical protein
MTDSPDFGTPPPNVPFRILTEIDRKATEWLWEPRIALGELTILDGDPESNKSSLLLDIAARVSTGQQMPDGTPGHKGGVVLLAGEDSIEKTVVPRLKAAGANLLNIAVPEKVITIPADLAALEEIALRMRAKLVLIDPIMVFLGRNANNDQSVRQALTPLKELAERLNMAVVMVRHLTKNGRRHFLYRGSGSIGIVAVTRTALLTGKHPKDPHLRVLAHGKSNLGPKAPSLIFEPVGTEDGVVKIEWRGMCDCRADDLLIDHNGQANPLEEAKNLLLARAWAVMETRRISEIIIDQCFRHDLGDIQALAESIRQFGLLRPVLITTDNQLVAGRRRLEACKLLGWETVQVNVIGGQANGPANDNAAVP